MTQKNAYHWLIVGSCFLLMAVSIGILVNCFNPLVPALRAHFGGDEGGSIQLIFTIAVLANLVGGALAGKIMSKVPMRKIMPVYAIVMSAGIFGWSMSTHLWQLYVVSILVGLGASGISLVPCGILINNWFQEKKGVATGIAFTGSVAGGLVFVQLTQYIVSNFGWQKAYLVLGIIAAAISIPVTLFIIRGTPQEKGMLPYGATGEKTSNTTAEVTGIKLGKFIKTSSFWLLAISGFFIGFANVGVQNNISTYLTDVGYTSTIATMAFSIGLFVQIFGKFLLGWFYDKKGVIFSQIYCLLCFIGCITLLILSNGSSIAIAFAFGAVFGLVASMTTVTPPYLTARIVGVRDYATIFGIMSLFYGLGVASGPMVVEGLYTSIGWTPIWIGLTIMSAIMAVTTILAHRKSTGFASEKN
ncbi:MAG: MFS transporter [Treponema sp.]|nr:MFS transporter [Treponema sp.]